MRIRLEVDNALDQISRGAPPRRLITRVVPRINIELDRETNGLGEHYDTCKQIRDGLVELEQLQEESRKTKVEELRGLARQLPELSR